MYSIFQLSAVPIPSRAFTTLAVEEGKGEKRDRKSEHDSNDSKRTERVFHGFVIPSEEGKYRTFLLNATLRNANVQQV